MNPNSVYCFLHRTFSMNIVSALQHQHSKSPANHSRSYDTGGNLVGVQNMFMNNHHLDRTDVISAAAQFRAQ